MHIYVYICVCIWAKINCGHDDIYDVFPVPEAIRAPRKSKIYVFQSGRYTYTYIFNIYWRSACTCNAGVHGDLRGRTCIRAHRPPLHVPVESYIIDCGSGDPVGGDGRRNCWPKIKSVRVRTRPRFASATLVGNASSGT